MIMRRKLLDHINGKEREESEEKEQGNKECIEGMERGKRRKGREN